MASEKSGTKVHKQDKLTKVPDLPLCIYSDIMKFMTLKEIMFRLMVLNKAVRKEIISQNYIMFKKFTKEYSLNKRLLKSDVVVNHDVFQMVR